MFKDKGVIKIEGRYCEERFKEERILLTFKDIGTYLLTPSLPQDNRLTI